MESTLNPTLDAHDTRILAELQKDARLTMAELGRRVHLSQPAVTERVKKLEAAGVISGYRATVNLGKLGYGIRAMIRVGRADYDRVVKLVQDTPECVNAYNVTGEDSWILEIAVIDVSHLDGSRSPLPRRPRAADCRRSSGSASPPPGWSGARPTSRSSTR